MVFIKKRFFLNNERKVQYNNEKQRTEYLDFGLATK